MHWKPWYARRLWTACLSLLVILLSVVWLAWPSNQPASSSIVNHIRLLTNTIVHTLENEFVELLPPDAPIREKLTGWSQETRIGLKVVLPDGTMIYDSDDSSVRRIHPRFELDYTLRMSDGDPPDYHLAFPLLDAGTNAFAGYAQFTVPASAATAATPSSGLLLVVPWTLLSLALLTLLYILFSTGRRVQRDLVEPVAGLKPYAEAILKGDYEQRAEWASNNEVGELYAVFDLMREEIRNLHMQQASHSQSHKELISNLSHDLKTPLATIKAYIDAIREGICPDLPSVMAYLEVVHANTSKMAVLVDDLLLHALRDLDQIAVRPLEQYSSSTIEPVLRTMAHYIRTMGVRCAEPSSIPNVLVIIDAVRFEQVIANLVTNALKHTKPGDTITLAVEELAESSSLRIIISDTGSGISPQDMPFIFERYYQGGVPDRKKLAERHGVGLGLSICKYIMEAHGGTITFHSKQQQGTTFCLTLPLS
ncbi:HAMP domain-containing histidine kinase [Paenibacillus sp. AK002]